MAEAGVIASPSRSSRALEKLRMTAGIVAAIAGAITGLWTIYEKVKSDARQYTADSYETLAPQLNQVTEALRQIQKENAQLRQALAVHAPPAARARIQAADRKATAKS